MQKIINVLAVASFAVSGAVVGSGLYVYVNRDSIVDGVKSQIMEAVTGSLGGLGSLGGAGLAPELPTGSNDLPSTGGDLGSASGSTGLGLPSTTPF